MPILEVIDRLRNRVARRTESAAETLWSAAKRLASGESADDGVVEVALAEARATVDDFAVLVELARKRRAWFSKFDRGNSANARLAKAQSVAERERGEFEKIAAQWRARAAELDAEIAAAQRDADAALDAREQLVAPDNVPEPVHTRLVDAIAARKQAAERVSAIQREIRDAKQSHEHHTGFAEYHGQFNTSGHGGNADDHARFAKRFANRLAELELALQAANADATAAGELLTQAEAAALKT